MYLELISESVELVRQGRSSADVPRTGVEATPERAEELGKRLAFVREKIMPFLHG